MMGVGDKLEGRGEGCGGINIVRSGCWVYNVEWGKEEGAEHQHFHYLLRGDLQ